MLLRAITGTIAAISVALSWWTYLRDRRRRRATRVELAEMRQRAHAALTDTALFVLAIGEDGAITWADGSDAHLSLQTCVGQRYRQLLADHDDLIDAVHEARAGEPVSRDTDWNGRPVRILVRPIFNAVGAVHEVILCLVDVADEAAERARADRLAEFRHDFLATVNEQLRSPINGVLAMTRLLESSRMSRAARERIALTRESGECMLEFVDDMIDFGDLDAGRTTIEPEAFDLRELIEELVAVHQDDAAGRDVRLAARYPQSVTAQVRGDRRRIRRMLDSLIAISIERSRHGQVIVNVDERERRSDAVTLDISVEDSTVMLPPTALRLLNEPFSGSTMTMLRDVPQYGIRFAVSRGLAELMGGDLEVASHADHGTTTTVTLDLARTVTTVSMEPLRTAPRERRGANRAFASPAGSADDSAGPASYTLLLADEDGLQRRIMSQMLEAIGHRVTTAADADDLLAALDKASYDKASYDVVFLGGILQTAAGADVVTCIRERTDGHSAVPIVAITADAMRGSRQRYLDAGMDDYLSKPVRMERLAAVVERWGEGAAARVSAAAGHASVIDRAVIDRLRDISRENGPGVADDLIEAFLDGTPHCLIRIQDAVDRGDFDAIPASIDLIATGSRLLGVVGLNRLCTDLQAALAADDHAAVEQVVAHMRRQYSIVEHDLRAVLKHEAA